MREYQVRICEGLGVKFPGPTRHKHTLRRWLRANLMGGFNLNCHPYGEVLACYRLSTKTWASIRELA
jgi:hypothetical protein